VLVTEAGVVYVSTADGKLVALKDTDGDGAADEMETREAPIHTGLALHDGHLYVADRVSVSRIPLPSDGLLPQGEFESVVSGFPDQRSHSAKTIAISPAGDLYVNVGAPSNACQEEQRTPGSPGQEPCPQLEKQAGVWKFDADATGQTQGDGERYVTGLRNAVALDWHAEEDALFLVQHGRDQLHQLFPDLYTEVESAELPAEELHRIASAGADLGWPYTYYDPEEGARMQAPEYGGDGETTSERGQTPEVAFPGHWAPNDLVFYAGEAFPERYHGGAFVAFHGSWNRAPQPQEGYRVQFVPMSEEGLGAPEDFATGFPGEETFTSPSAAEYRPTGLAVGPDGALYIADSVKGRVWRVTYSGE